MRLFNCLVKMFPMGGKTEQVVTNINVPVRLRWDDYTTKGHRRHSFGPAWRTNRILCCFSTCSFVECLLLRALLEVMVMFVSFDLVSAYGQTHQIISIRYVQVFYINYTSVNGFKKKEKETISSLSQNHGAANPLFCVSHQGGFFVR